MVSRRGLLGGAAALAAALSGCSLRGKDVSADAQKAAEAVDGVSSVALEQRAGANFERLLNGRIEIAEEDRATGIAVYDDAMRVIVTVIHDRLDDSEARSLRVGGIMAELADGTELDVFVLDPDTPGEDPRLDQVHAGAFYGRYGLT
ncbi:hypothetical protein [Brachybacterium saurashtrense]|nr:hypothetical protein [Brachybacterium saurashtrense]